MHTEVQNERDNAGFHRKRERDKTGPVGRMNRPPSEYFTTSLDSRRMSGSAQSPWLAKLSSFATENNYRCKELTFETRLPLTAALPPE